MTVLMLWKCGNLEVFVLLLT